jgi:sortase A
MGPRGRRWQLRAGLLLIAVGLVLIGYVAWQFYGTNVVARHHRDEVLGELHRAWDDGETDARTGRGRAEEVIRIPRFGKGYEVPVLEGTSDTVLATGFGHYDGTAAPGGVGNYALAAHRVTHGQPLRDMPDLQPGDLVYVDTARTTYTYRLTTGGDDLVVPFTAGWVLDPLPTNPDGGVEPDQAAGQRLLTLTTCSELFHTDDRMVAFGVLVDTSPRK